MLAKIKSFITLAVAFVVGHITSFTTVLTTAMGLLLTFQGYLPTIAGIVHMILPVGDVWIVAITAFVGKSIGILIKVITALRNGQSPIAVAATKTATVKAADIPESAMPQAGS